MQHNWKGISASTLKFIAIISMLIDHFAVAIYSNLPGAEYTTTKCLRLIGRIAFPIYCFLLVEGFFHTNNIKKYIGRMFLFALLSEIPFDMAGYGMFFYGKAQNVFFTLTLGLVVIYCLHRCKTGTYQSLVLQAFMIAAGALLAQIGEFDYHYMGILLIVMLYYLRNVSPVIRDILGACAFSYEVTAPLAFIPIHFYNGTRGLSLKYFFYFVYPVHLFLFGCIRMYFI